MSRRIARCIAPLFVFIPLTSLFSGCGERVTVAEKVEAAPPTFASPDADAPEAASGLTQYCPSDECPTGYTTCPLSSFRCEVNFLTDRNNCGACGVVCPALDYERGALFECVDGACAMQCVQNFADCDGLLDNGCEVRIDTNDDCGVCGNKCAPDQPCNQGINGLECGCPDGKIYCGEAGCVDSDWDDAHCGVCGNACDPGAIENNTYKGCVKGECGRTKCAGLWGNCDNDPSNGCEAPLDTDDNCSACGAACGDAQKCRWFFQFPVPPFLACACPEGRSFCEIGLIDYDDRGPLPVGNCHDFSSDEGACGGCGVTCRSLRHNCEFGVCRLNCLDGTADCNGSEIDGCEVNTNADPSNCGGCGIECDGVAGQACVGGRCVVKPCDDVDAGGGMTR